MYVCMDAWSVYVEAGSRTPWTRDEHLDALDEVAENCVVGLDYFRLPRREDYFTVPYFFPKKRSATRFMARMNKGWRLEKQGVWGRNIPLRVNLGLNFIVGDSVKGYSYRSIDSVHWSRRLGCY